MRKVVFCDIETTGLDPLKHDVWEIALIEEDGTEHHWFLRPLIMENAEESALAVNRFYERTEHEKWSNPNDVADAILEITDDAHLCGANPRFDEEFLRYFVKDWAKEQPRWHHRVIDIEAMAMVHYNRRTPPSMNWLRETGDFDAPKDVEHTAMGDARAVRDIYCQILNVPSTIR